MSCTYYVCVYVCVCVCVTACESVCVVYVGVRERVWGERVTPGEEEEGEPERLLRRKCDPSQMRTSKTMNIIRPYGHMSCGRGV